MSARTIKLLEVVAVTDHDCGNYRIGEIDFGISGSLYEHLKKYGRDGKEEIIRTLAYLIFETERQFQSLPNGSHRAVQKAKE